MVRVIRKHRGALEDIDAELVPEGLLSAAKNSWDEALSLGEVHGYRNAQASVLAPTGTIGLMMDCDTTGIEPDLALVKTKKLVGGGTMQFVNQTVPRALERLGYDAAQTEDIVAYIAEHNSTLDAPHLKPEHQTVFDTSMGAQAIHYMGHVRMMAAAQPFISGAISKTVNMPESVTVEEVEQLFVESWKLGLKAVAIYRDNCKVAQPMSADKKKGASAAPDGEPQTLPWSSKKRLPQSRPAITTSFQVGDAEGYITAGSYPDDGLGELFMKVSKQGSTLSGIMDAFSIAVSVGTAVRGAAGGLRLEVHQHEVRALRHDERPGHPIRVLDRRLRVPASGARSPVRRAARGPGYPVDRGAEGLRPGGGGGEDRRLLGAGVVAGAAADRDHAGTRRQAQRRAALLLVRLEDAAGRLVLRLLELRQHQRLLVGIGYCSPHG